MNTPLTDAERLILLGILADTRRLRAEADRLRACPPSIYTGARRVQEGRRLWELTRALEFGPRVDLAVWLGAEPTPAVRQAGCRALARLEAAGLIERSGPLGGRLTHARLTAVGVSVAKEAARAEAAP